MKYTDFRIILLSGIGAWIGTILALSMGSFWLFGALIGGIVGLWAYNAKNITAHVVLLGRSACNKIRKLSFNVTIPSVSRPSLHLLKTFGISLLLITKKIIVFGTWFILALTSVASSVFVLFFLAAEFATKSFFLSIDIALGISIIATATGVIIVLLVLTGEPDDFVKRNTLILQWNAIIVYFLLTKWILMRLIPGLVLLFAFLISEIIIGVYSHEGLLVGFSSAVGGTIGWFARSPIVGSIVGGVLGEGQYRIFPHPHRQGVLVRFNNRMKKSFRIHAGMPLA